MSDRRESSSRRGFVGGLALAGTASLLGLRPEPAAADPPPETFTLRIQRPVKTLPGVCVAPQLVADEMLKLEGFH